MEKTADELMQEIFLHPDEIVKNDRVFENGVYSPEPVVIQRKPVMKFYKPFIEYDDDRDQVSILQNNQKAIFTRDQCRKFIHDYTFRSVSAQTDVKLSNIFNSQFSGSHLTPDFLLKRDDERKIAYILEVTTRQWGNPAGNPVEVREKVEMYRPALSTAFNKTGYSTVMMAMCVTRESITGPPGLNPAFVDRVHKDFCNASYLRSELEEQDFPIHDEDRNIIGHFHSNWFITEEQSKINQEILTEFTRIKPKFDEGYWTEHFYRQCCSFSHTRGDVEQMMKDSDDWALEKMTKLHEKASEDVSHYWTDYQEKLRSEPTQRSSTKAMVFLPYYNYTEQQGNTLLTGLFPTLGKRTPMQRVWSEAFMRAREKDWESIHLNVDETFEKSIFNIVSEKKETVSERRQNYAVKLDLLPADQEYIGQRGVEGKRAQDPGERAESKKGLDPESDVSDVETFLNYRTLTLSDLTRRRTLETFEKLIEPQITRKEVKNLAERLVTSDMFNYMKMISDISIELCMSMRTNVRRNQQMIKKLRDYDAYLLIKTTTASEHIFFSLCARVDDLKHREISSLPLFNAHEIVECSNQTWVITKYWSFKQDRLSHLTKAAGTCFSLLASTANHFTDDFDPSKLSESAGEFSITPDQNKIFNFCLLLYLENKPHTENAWTLIRYPYMESFKPPEIPINPWKIFSKFPSVIRSRLQLYCLKSIAELCKSLHLRRPVYNGLWQKIQCPILKRDITAHQCIKTMFFGYVVSKDLQSERNMSFQLAEKIYNFEYKFRDLEGKYKELGEIITKKAHYKKPDWHEYDYRYISVIAYHLTKKLELAMGPSWSTIMQGKILNDFKYQNLSKVTTLKASASYKGQDRNEFFKGIDKLTGDLGESQEDGAIRVLGSLPGAADSSYSGILSKMRMTSLSHPNPGPGDVRRHQTKMNKMKVTQKILVQHVDWNARPRVAEAFVLLRDQLVAEGKIDEDESRLFMFVRPSLEILNERGSIYVDLFRKAQHAGLREIYVIEICARIVQLFLESIARTYCKEFPSEVMENPKGKYEIPLGHYKQMRSKYERFISLSDAADAAKWNNAHFVPKFADFMMKMVPAAFRPFIFQSMKLWTNKDIMLPIDLLISFQHNASAPTQNEVYRKMREEYLQPERGGIMEPNKISMMIKSGMMQGILHFTSSLLHTAHQEYLEDEVLRSSQFDSAKDLESCCQQSSDDSSFIVSFPLNEKGELLNPTERNPNVSVMIQRIDFFYHKKDMLGRLAGIFESDEKTSRTLLFTHEFNTEFFLDSEWLRPTNKWIYASQATLVVESFIERFEQNYNSISDCLSGGATSFEASLAQIGQAFTHYNLMGFSVNALAIRHSRLLKILPDPALGYFILSSSVSPGIYGYNFELYKHLKRHDSYSQLMSYWLKEISQTTAGQLTRGGSRMFGVKLRMGNINIYDGIMKRMGMHADIEEHLDDKPEVLFREPKDWSEALIHIYHKMTAPSVVQSLSQFCAESRMVASAGFLMHTHCITIGFNWRNQGEKFTLPGVWYKMFQHSRDSKPLQKEDYERLFPLSGQYDEALYRQSILEKRPMTYGSAKTKSRMRITVLKSLNDMSIKPSSYCSYKWWKENRPMGNRDYIDYQWSSLKMKYDFLHDSWNETRDYFGKDVRSVEICDLILRLTSEKDRVLFLTSSVGSNHTFTIDSLMARNFCHGYELRLGRERSTTSDKANFFLMALCQAGARHKSVLDALSYLMRTDIWLKELEWREDSPYFPLVVMREVVAQNLLVVDEKNRMDFNKIWNACSRHKKGVIGRFIVDESKALGVHGIWEGNVGDTPTRISGLDGYCTSITIRDSKHQTELEPLLAKLLKDLRWSNFRAEPHSIVFNGKRLLKKSKGVPVFMNSEMKFLLEPKSCTLTFDATPFELRLRLNLGTVMKDSEKKGFTMLSYKARPEGMFYTQNHPDLKDILNSILEGDPIKINWISSMSAKKNKRHSVFKRSFTQNELMELRYRDDQVIAGCKMKWLRNLFTLSLRKCYQQSRPMMDDQDVDNLILKTLTDEQDIHDRIKTKKRKLELLRSAKTGKLTTDGIMDWDYLSLTENESFVKNLPLICDGMETIVTTRVDKLLNANIYMVYSSGVFEQFKKVLSDQEMQMFFEESVWPSDKVDFLLTFGDHLDFVPRIESLKITSQYQQRVLLAEEDGDEEEFIGNSIESYKFQPVAQHKVIVPDETLIAQERALDEERFAEVNRLHDLEQEKIIQNRKILDEAAKNLHLEFTDEWVEETQKSKDWAPIPQGTSWADLMDEEEQESSEKPQDNVDIDWLSGSEEEIEEEPISEHFKDLGFREGFRRLSETIAISLKTKQWNNFVEEYNTLGKDNLWHWAIQKDLFINDDTIRQYDEMRNLVPVDVPGDGDCGLHALAVSLGLEGDSTLEYFKKLLAAHRSSIPEEVRRHAEMERPSGDNYYSVDDLSIISQLHERNLVVVHFLDHHITRFQQMSTDKDTNVYVLILGNAPGKSNHFNGLRQRE